MKISQYSINNSSIVVLLLLVVSSCFAETIIENEEVTGSLHVGESISYELSTYVDWRYYAFVAQVSLSLFLFEVIS